MKNKVPLQGIYSSEKRFNNKRNRVVHRAKRNICYSPAGRSVLEKTVPDALDTARGRRPRAVSKTEGTVFPNTDRPSAGE